MWRDYTYRYVRSDHDNISIVKKIHTTATFLSNNKFSLSRNPHANFVYHEFNMSYTNKQLIILTLNIIIYLEFHIRITWTAKLIISLQFDYTTSVYTRI